MHRSVIRVVENWQEWEDCAAVLQSSIEEPVGSIPAFEDQRISDSELRAVLGFWSDGVLCGAAVVTPDDQDASNVVHALIRSGCRPRSAGAADRLSDMISSRLLMLNGLAVVDGQRRSGIATAMKSHLCDEGRQRGYEWILSNATNTAAVKLNHAAGWSLVSYPKALEVTIAEFPVAVALPIEEHLRAWAFKQLDPAPKVITQLRAADAAS